MDDSGTYMNVKFTKTDSETPSRDGLNPTYSLLKPPKDEHLMEEYEDIPFASGPAEVSVAAQADPHKQEPNKNNGKRPYCLICLLCLVIFVLFVTVAGISIHVSQIRQSKVTSDRNYHELNSTLQSKVFENSQLDLSQRTCLKNLSAIKSNLSDLKRMHSDLRHQFTEMETKYRSVKETKTQICELLTSRRAQNFSRDWFKNEKSRYFISTLTTSYNEAKEDCSNLYARLLEINSKQEKNVISNALVHQDRAYWIGKCEDGEETPSLIYKHENGRSVCGNCYSDQWKNFCNGQHHFICEKCEHSSPYILEKIQDLCQ